MTNPTKKSTLGDQALAADASSLQADDPIDVDRPEEPKPPQDEQPAWWHQALALEAEGKLEEAEETISKSVDHIGYAASVANMYAKRMIRLMQAGDEMGALEAFGKADQWIFYYASMATSGGEGAALSLQRDQFRAQLVQLLGRDPVDEKK